MNKAFVKEGSEDSLSLLPEMPVGVRNYITPDGYRRLQHELQQLTQQLMAAARRELAQDEPTDQHGSVTPPSSDNMGHALRELEQRIDYLRSRLETAEIVDPGMHHGQQQIFFGATVVYQNAAAESQTVTIVGLDELDPSNGKISWLSPVAQALLKAHEGDSVAFDSPAGIEELRILSVQYPQLQPQA